MKRTLLFLLPLLLVACATKLDHVELTDWHFKYNGRWYPATVPGFIHTDLMDNGLIPDPYMATNEDSVGWVNLCEWEYRTVLRGEDIPEGPLYLVCEGLAGNALVTWVAFWGDLDPEVGTEAIDNMFVESVIPISTSREHYDSILVIVSFSPLADSVREVDYGIPLPDWRAFTRIAPYQQGWDWGPTLPTCGIWKPVYITSRKPSMTSSTSITSSTRKVELRQERDSIGQSFTFYRDGKPLFVMGANWIPVHSFPVLDSANRARYRHLLCSAKEAGFNMLRLWGGGIYEHDYFFDLCDSLDIMVWMDFNFSTMLYPDDSLMLESIKEEAYQNVRRIAKHPCVVLWCGNNEVKNGWEDWGWQGVYKWTPEQRARLEKAMDTLFGYTSMTSNTSATSLLAQAVRDCDPLHRPYITTSPLYGWGHPECITHGDSHYWGVWWGEEPFEKYAEKTGRFMSEYGFQSYPMISTIRQFCPEDQLYIDSPTLKNHQKHSRGREIIDKAMMQYYGCDSKSLNLEDFCYISQLLQAWGTGYGIFQHIKHQPHCMGTLYWQLNDCWPVASWSSIDFYGNWKALHYRVQALYADDVNLRQWEQYYCVYPKDRTYSEPKYTFHLSSLTSHLEVTITAESDLYDVYLETEPHLNGHFTHNFFDLRKGETLTSRFIPVDPKADIGNLEVRVKTLNEVMLR